MSKVFENDKHLIDPAFFNTDRKYGVETDMFLCQPAGLLDSIHRVDTTIFDIYKSVKKLDWDENEYPYGNCKNEFLNRPKHIVRKMIETIAFQWHTDSGLSSISGLISLFNPQPDVWLAYQRVSDQEGLHGLTYAEIVRLSFPNPEEVLKDILNKVEPFQRLAIVGNTFGKIREVGLKYQLNLIELAKGTEFKDINTGFQTMEEYEQHVYDHAFLLVYALYLVERIQFMSSFAVTFAIGEEKMFTPIVQAVRRICQDEWEMHVLLDVEVLRRMLASPRGKDSYRRLRPLMNEMLDEVCMSELKWGKHLFSDGEDLDKLNERKLRDWVCYSGTMAAKLFSLDCSLKEINENPLPYMENSLTISKVQQSNQEETNGQYMMNLIRHDDQDVIFHIDGRVMPT